MRHPTTRKFPFVPAPETEVEELIADICDNKCKYVDSTGTWMEMADICTTCPMVKIYEKLIEKTNTGCKFKSQINWIIRRIVNGRFPCRARTSRERKKVTRMYRESDYSILKVFVIIVVILWIMFELSTCMQYKDVPSGDVPKWVDWVL